MQISIREATAADIPAVFSLLQEFATFQKTPEKVTISVKEMVEAQNLFQCLIAENKDREIVGFASYFFAFYSWSGKALYLDDLYVQTSWRGNRIGSRLLEAAITRAKEAGCRKVRWQVSSWNENAIAFYKKVGAYVDNTELNCDLLFPNSK